MITNTQSLFSTFTRPELIIDYLNAHNIPIQSINEHQITTPAMDIREFYLISNITGEILFETCYDRKSSNFNDMTTLDLVDGNILHLIINGHINEMGMA